MTNYDRLYSDFDSELMRRIRREAYGRDIGQYSWLTADELEAAIPQLAVGSGSRLLDVGCGPGGPLAFVVERTGCIGIGLDSSAEAVEAASARLSERLSIVRHDANLPLPFGDQHFDAVMSIDAVLHVRDREALFREVARVLRRGGRFWFTDAAVVFGAVSNEELAARAPLGLTQFVPAGYNDSVLGTVGFTAIASDDRTDSVVANASGRIEARLKHRGELESAEGLEPFQAQQRYLDAVVALARRGALRRISYTAAVP